MGVLRLMTKVSVVGMIFNFCYTAIELKLIVLKFTIDIYLFSGNLSASCWGSRCYNRYSRRREPLISNLLGSEAIIVANCRSS